jgi:hypothetical protein
MAMSISQFPNGFMMLVNKLLISHVKCHHHSSPAPSNKKRHHEHRMFRRRVLVT